MICKLYNFFYIKNNVIACVWFLICANLRNQGQITDLTHSPVSQMHPDKSNRDCQTYPVSLRGCLVPEAQRAPFAKEFGEKSALGDDVPEDAACDVGESEVAPAVAVG